MLGTYPGSINTMVPLTHQSPDTPSTSALAWTTYSSAPIIDSSLDLLTYLLYPYELSMLVMTLIRISQSRPIVLLDNRLK